eukprot:2381982-Rhodomonas_salina.2
MPRALIRWVTTPASMSEQPPTRSVSLGLPRHAKSNPRNHLSAHTSRAGAHHQAFKRSQPHGGVDAPADRHQRQAARDAGGTTRGDEETKHTTERGTRNAKENSAETRDRARDSRSKETTAKARSRNGHAGPVAEVADDGVHLGALHAQTLRGRARDEAEGAAVEPVLADVMLALQLQRDRVRVVLRRDRRVERCVKHAHL